MTVTDVIREALDLRKLNLPDQLSVIDLKWEDYTDMDGEPALRITVVIDEQTDVDGLDGDQIGTMKSEIRRRLQ